MHLMSGTCIEGSDNKKCATHQLFIEYKYCCQGGENLTGDIAISALPRQLVKHIQQGLHNLVNTDNQILHYRFRNTFCASR